MLEHLFTEPTPPQRAIVLGAGGFIGGACLKRLQKAGIDTLPITRNEVELLADGAANRLAEYIKDNDSLIVISAKAPVKNNDMLLENIIMMRAICAAIGTVN